MSEHSDQVALFAKAKWEERNHPELKNMFAIPNGGARHKAVASKLKREGVKAGVPDIFLAHPKGSYAGLWIEMKYGKNKTIPKQREWLRALSDSGYQTEVCYGVDEAWQVILDYLETKNVVRS